MLVAKALTTCQRSGSAAGADVRAVPLADAGLLDLVVHRVLPPPSLSRSSARAAQDWQPWRGIASRPLQAVLGSLPRIAPAGGSVRPPMRSSWKPVSGG